MPFEKLRKPTHSRSAVKGVRVSRTRPSRNCFLTQVTVAPEIADQLGWTVGLGVDCLVGTGSDEGWLVLSASRDGAIRLARKGRAVRAGSTRIPHPNKKLASAQTSYSIQGDSLFVAIPDMVSRATAVAAE
jgi:hypothetical protein